MYVYMHVPEQEECACMRGDMCMHTYVCVCTHSDTHAQKTHFSPVLHPICSPAALYLLCDFCLCLETHNLLSQL